MRYLTTLCLLISFYAVTHAQATPGAPEETGVWFSAEELNTVSSDWQAQWIWLSEEPGYEVMLARRVFELPAAPDQAELRITASTQYQLYVNGVYVRRGPARSAPHHQSFDILNIRDMLRKGKNTLAVRVHYQAGKNSYHHSGRAGLLAQLDLSSGGATSSVITDADWKVSPDPSWDDDAPRISRFQLVVNDRVDLREALSGWETPDFDDTGWPDATALMRNVGWPGPQRNARPQALTPPWVSLVPRDVPYLQEKEQRAVDLIEATPMTANPHPLSGRIDARIAGALSEYREGSGPLIIPSSNTSESWLLLFDLGRVVNGMPQLEIEGPAGTEVEVLCAPFMVHDQFTHKVVDSEFLDRIVLSGARDRWEATYFKPTRYLGVVVRGGPEAVRLYHAGIRSLAYPFEQKGAMHSTDAQWIEQYMEASAKTILACTTDAYADNYRERRQYAQTGYYAALGNYWLFGDHALQRRYLVQVAQEQQANGLMPAYAPLAADDYMVILDSNCLWIRSLRNYYLYSGDEKTTRELLPAARKLMDLLHSYTHSLGFLYNPPYPYWLDHARNDRRGVNFCLNGHYLGALEDFAEIMDWLGESGAEGYRERAKLLRRSLRENLWDEEKGLFTDAWIDGEHSDQFSEHANAMALAMQVATKEQAGRVAAQLLVDDEHNYIQRANGMTMVTPAMSYFLHKGLCEYGYVEESLRMFRQRFDKMLAPGTNGTLWEEWWLDGTGRSGRFQGGRTRSDAQTESAFPPALFGEFLLGIRPVEPGMRLVEIRRPPSFIASLEGVVPTPEGALTVHWHFDGDGGGELELSVPGAMRINLDLNTLRAKRDISLLVDGRALRGEERKQSSISLSKGRHIITF